MTKNKLISILSTFNSDEWKSVRQRILTKTSKSSDVFKLFETIYKKRDSGLEEWNSQKIHEKRFKSITRKTFLNMMSTLTGWVEESLIIQNTLAQTIEAQLSLLSIYNNRGLYTLADQLFEKAERTIVEINVKDERRKRLLILLYDTIYYSDNPIKYKDNRGSEILRALAGAQIENGIETEHLYLAELYNWGKLKNQDFSELIKRMSEKLAVHPLHEEHHLSLLINIVRKKDFDSFLKLKDAVLMGDWDYSSMNHTVITSYLVTYVMKFWQQGALKDSRIITELYDYGFKTGALLVNGRLPEKRFHNIVSTIGGLSTNGWSLEFIQKWGDKVSSKNPEANISLAKAQYYFYKKRYSEITPILRSLKFESNGQQTRLMGLQLIAWFEERNEHPDIFLQFAQTFKKFLVRHKSSLSPHYHDSHKNLIKLLQELHKNKPTHKMAALLDNTERVIYRKYLLEKMA